MALKELLGHETRAYYSVVPSATVYVILIPWYLPGKYQTALLVNIHFQLFSPVAHHFQDFGKCS